MGVITRGEIVTVLEWGLSEEGIRRARECHVPRGGGGVREGLRGGGGRGGSRVKGERRGKEGVEEGVE